MRPVDYFVICVGADKENLEPIITYPDKDEAIKEAEKLVDLFYEFAKVISASEVWMKPDEVVWRSWNDED